MTSRNYVGSLQPPIDTCSRIHRSCTGVYLAETEIHWNWDDSHTKRQKNIDCHSPRPLPYVYHFPDPPWFSLQTTFKVGLKGVMNHTHFNPTFKAGFNSRTGSMKSATALYLFYLYMNFKLLRFSIRVPSGQIGSKWEWYHWKALEKDINRYMFLIF